MRVTSRDVAKYAGVSTATVSRVFSDSPLVREETRKKVKRAAEALGYVPNGVARSLAKQRTGLLGLVVADVTNPFYSELALIVEAAAAELGYRVIVCNTLDRSRRQKAYIHLLREHRVDGIILGSVFRNDDYLVKIAEAGFPMVMVNRYLHNAQGDFVIVDNVKGARMVVEHLVSEGHTRIAHISGPKNVSNAVDRLAGYMQALREAGIRIDEQLIIQGDFSRESGYRATRRLLRLVEPPTAIFAEHDNMAIGAVSAVLEAGLRIPEDIAIVGFDDIELASLDVISLSTVSQRLDEMGTTAVSVLHDKITGKSNTPQRIVMEPELILRRSCGHARTRHRTRYVAGQRRSALTL